MFNSASAKLLSFIISFLAFPLAGCTNNNTDGKIVITLTINNADSDIKSVRIFAALNGQDSRDDQRFSDKISPVGVRLNAGSRGMLSISVEGYGVDPSCILTRGNVSLDIQSDDAREASVDLVKNTGSLTIQKSGNGTGMIVSDPIGINCGSQCNYDFPLCQRVKISASIATGSHFLGWTGACGGTETCEVIAGNVNHITARFTSIPIRTCAPDGWCWENPKPQGNDLSSIWGTSSKNIWAVGSASTIMHYDGNSWVLTPLPPKLSGYSSIQGIWAADANNVFALAFNYIIRWNGEVWEILNGQDDAFTQNKYYSSIWGIDSKNVWAVGRNGTVSYWDGVSVKSVDVGSQTYLYGIWGTAQSNLWAVGDSGKIFHRDASSWTPVASGTSEPLIGGIWGTGPNDAWAFGQIGVMLHWDGISWRQHGQSLNLFRPWSTSTGDYWAVGVNGVYRWDGSSWKNSGNLAANSIWGSRSDDIWTVGPAGRIDHWDGTNWNSAFGNTIIGDLTAIWGSNANDIWAVGATENNLIHWDGTTWSKVSSGTTSKLNALWGAAANDVWAVGEGGAATHWNGTTWSTKNFPDGTLSVKGICNNWAVARNYNQIWQWDGAQWNGTHYNFPGLNAIFCAASNDIWAVGSNTVVRWNGTTWAEVKPSPLPAGRSFELEAIWGTSSSYIWIVGATLRLFWNGSTWTQTEDNLYWMTGLWGVSSLDAWAIGLGTIHHIEGQTWTRHSYGVGSRLRGIWGSRYNDIWAVGDGGAIVHYKF